MAAAHFMVALECFCWGRRREKGQGIGADISLEDMAKKHFCVLARTIVFTMTWLFQHNFVSFENTIFVKLN